MVTLCRIVNEGLHVLFYDFIQMTSIRSHDDPTLNDKNNKPVLPDRRQDEKELHKHGAEGEDTPHKRRHGRRHVPGGRGDLPRDCVRANGHFNRLKIEKKR